MKSQEQPYRSPTLTPPSSNADRMVSSTSNGNSPLDRKRAFENGDSETLPLKKRRRDGSTPELEVEVGDSQEVLLLHGPKQRYIHTKDYEIPASNTETEMLVKVQAIGLNPIDWKAPDFGWGLPALPCISGRDFAGVVARKPKSKSRFKPGDRVLGISTDYRDFRKSAFQEYSIVSDFNACRLPAHLSTTATAPLGVAFVAAALALGICLGIDFSKGPNGVKGPNMKQIVQAVEPEKWPKDVREECSNGIPKDERPVAGDWIAIWGGSSATGCCATQLCKLAGLRVICILDVEKNGERLLKHGADLLVDRHDTARAIAIIRGVTKGKLRYGLDTRGKESATLLADALELSAENDVGRAHLVGLTGLPKEVVKGVMYHSVPIKTFHEAPELGEAMMLWLEKLLEERLLLTPDMETAEGGLLGINDALDRLRDGSVNGPRIVVPL